MLEKVRSTSKNRLIASIKGVASRRQAECLQGARLYVNRSNLPAPGVGEYYIADLQGLRAFDKNGSLIGRVIAANNFGAGDIIDIALPNSERSIYVPFDRKSVVSVEIEKGRIILDLPEGTL